MLLALLFSAMLLLILASDCLPSLDDPGAWVVRYHVQMTANSPKQRFEFRHVLWAAACIQMQGILEPESQDNNHSTQHLGYVQSSRPPQKQLTPSTTRALTTPGCRPLTSVDSLLVAEWGMPLPIETCDVHEGKRGELGGVMA